MPCSMFLSDNAPYSVLRTPEVLACVSIEPPDGSQVKVRHIDFRQVN